MSWGLLASNVDRLARGLAARGVRRGDRVAVLITPGADLMAVEQVFVIKATPDSQRVALERVLTKVK